VIEFRILGTLEVVRDGHAVEVGAGRQRALLALLLLARNTAVGSDRIVEELWNGNAPATASKVVQNLVSQLRRGIGGEEVLRTRGHGYELAVADEALDAGRFERLVEEGREALDDDPQRAAELLREALALWRGPALGELADEPWARAEAGRLEERRLVAFERRVDADLALGRHADLVGELEAAVAREPLRERLRAQLMLALYRSGRQADALEAYRAGRRVLIEELGIEPGPELTRLQAAILEQDPALDAPARRRSAPVGSARRRRGAARLIAGGVAFVAAAAAAGALLLAGGDDEAPAESAAEGRLIAVDLASGRVTRRIAAGHTPAVIDAAGGQVWAVDIEARTLIHVDANSDAAVDTLATGATPMDVGVSHGAAWVVNGTPRKRSLALGPVADELIRLDDGARRETSIELPSGGSDVDSALGGLIAVTPAAVWVVTADGSIARVDPATAAVTATTKGFRAFLVAAGGAGVWAAGPGGELVELDPRTARIRRHVSLPGAEPSGLAVGPTDVWVSSWADGKLWRVGQDRAAVPVSAAVGEGSDVVVAARGVWVVTPLKGAVVEVDPTSMRVRRSIEVAGSPRSIAVDGGTLWIAATGDAGAATSDVHGVRALPGTMCEPVIAARGGRADALIVSDLPLSGDARLTATEMAQAIQMVLREHGFRAGRLRLAYQSCDDAVAGTGIFDDAKCTRNGRAYARDADVVAVIGTLNSGCAFEMLPKLNRAHGGPLAMVSPINSYTGLTRDRPEVDVPTDLSDVYPTGTRSFVRVYAADDLQGGALAQLAADRGRRRAYVLEDGNPGYSDTIATAFETAARKLGLDVAGRELWRAKQPSYAKLADRIADSGADTVLLSGLLSSSGGALVHALRARLGNDVDLMAPDGFTPPAALLDAVRGDAKGMFLASNTLPRSALPPAGRAFVERFTRSHPGADADGFAVYAAQATEVLLQALARSDGTRGSVLEQLFAARVRNGLVGDVAFDEFGDLRPGTTVILRVTGGRGSTDLGSVGGAEVVRIAHPPRTLVERSR
jgi:DNA-binding SARP family transcriptional activator/ABC-type branched-subunit amino acid transport system substrate-binding protein